MHWLLNRGQSGWLLAIFNNNGVERTVAKGEVLLDQATSAVTISLRQGLNLRRLEGGEDLAGAGDQWTLHLPAGGWLLAALA